jgi:hypothetical protein
MITVTAKDALRSEQLDPGWVDGECVRYTQGVAGTDGSVVHKFEIEVIVPHTPVPVPISDYFISEKAAGMGKNFFLACGFPKEEWDNLVKGKATSSQINPLDCVGKKFKVLVTNEKVGNRIINKAGDFLPLER